MPGPCLDEFAKLSIAVLSLSGRRTSLSRGTLWAITRRYERHIRATERRQDKRGGGWWSGNMRDTKYVDTRHGYCEQNQGSPTRHRWGARGLSKLEEQAYLNPRTRPQNFGARLRILGQMTEYLVKMAFLGKAGYPHSKLARFWRA